MMTAPVVSKEEIRHFWESNPLMTGEFDIDPTSIRAARIDRTRSLKQYRRIHMPGCRIRCRRIASARTTGVGLRSGTCRTNQRRGDHRYRAPPTHLARRPHRRPTNTVATQFQ